MRFLSSPQGLGDTIYLRAVALHYLERGEPPTVFTQFPAAFSDLPITIRPHVEGIDRPDVQWVRYRLNEENPNGCSNFEAACLYAGIADPVALRMGWAIKNTRLIERIKGQTHGRRIFVYQPTKISRNELQDLLRPNRDIYNGFVAEHADHFRIKLGQPGYIEEDRTAPCDLDLFGRTSIPDAFDICSIADICFGESCFIPMVGEAMDKRFAIMFTRRALNSKSRVRNMTPERLFHKKHLALAVYDES